MKGKVLVIILLAFLFDMRDLSAQSIIEEKLEKLSLHLGNKDAKKAERIWKSFEMYVSLPYCNIGYSEREYF